MQIANWRSKYTISVIYGSLAQAFKEVKRDGIHRSIRNESSLLISSLLLPVITGISQYKPIWRIRLTQRQRHMIVL